MKAIRASMAEKLITGGLTLLAALLGLFAVPSAQADARTWSGGSGDWQTGEQGGWDGVWAAGDTGTFNGPGGTVTVKGDIATGNAALAFTAGGYTLQSDGAIRTITVSNTTVTLGDGVTTIGSNVTLARSGNNNPLTFDGNSTATSTLNVDSGGMAMNGSVAFTVKEATANVNPGGAIESGGALVVGDTTDGANFNVLGGTVTLGLVNANAVIALGNSGADSPTVNLKITGGSLGFTTPGTDNASNDRHGLRVGPATPGAGVVTAVIDLEGGIVTVRKIYESSSSYSSTLNLDGGTLRALANNPDYITVDNIWIKSGGVTFDSNGRSIAITRDLLTDSVSTGGGLTLNDTAATKGTLTLSGASITYTGPTLVSAGKLVVPSTHAGTGAVSVSADAALGVTVAGTSQWQPASLTLADGCTLEFNGVQNPGTSIAPLLPTAAVGAVTNVTINVNNVAGAALVGDKYPLLGNQGGTTAGYSLGTQPPGVTGSLGVEGNTLVYVVESAADIWTGTDGTNPTWWDIGSSVNWGGKAVINTPAGTYADGDNVVFDDSASPTSPVSVEIQTAVAPGKTIFNNSTKDYTIGGTSGLSGSGSLTKSGTGTLTLGTDNSYSGVTTLKQGTLSIAHNHALGSTAGATTISPTISGNASLILNNATADLTIAENLNFISTSTLRARLVNTSAFNHTLSGNINVDSSEPGAVTEFNGTAGSIIINGDITGTIGTDSLFLIRGGTAGVGGVIHGNITLTGGGLSKADNGTWTIGAPGKTYSAPIINANSGVLSLGADNYLAPTTILQLGNSTTSGGTFDLNGFSQTVAGLTTGNNSATAKTITSSSGLPVLTVNNDTEYAPHSSLALSGSLSLTKLGTGTLTLSGANTYYGLTTVGNGSLYVSTALQSGGNVAVADGAKFGVIRTVSSQAAIVGTLTLGSSGPTTLSFTNVADPALELLTTYGAVTLNGNCTIAVENKADLAVGNTYPLLYSYAGIVTNSGSGFGLSLPSGVSGYLTNDALGKISLVVQSLINPNPPSLITSFDGSSLIMDWPTNAGWILQVQTNGLDVGLSASWVDVPGSEAVTSVTNQVDPANGSVFYRLRLP